MGPADVANLAVAILQLSEVSDVIGAIRTADLSSGGGAGTAGRFIDGSAFGPAAVFEARRHLTPEPAYLPRAVLHPEPRYLPRPILHPTPIVEPQDSRQYLPLCGCSESSFHRHPPTIQPPWKILPWQTPVPPRPIVKLIRYQPDIPNKGDLLDIFI